MPQRSAGILLYRRRGRGGVEVLLVHPGGPFWAKKDEGAWSIPKGGYEPGEDPLAAARREFAEETGSQVRARRSRSAHSGSRPPRSSTCGRSRATSIPPTSRATPSPWNGRRGRAARARCPRWTGPNGSRPRRQRAKSSRASGRSWRRCCAILPVRRGQRPAEARKPRNPSG